MATFGDLGYFLFLHMVLNLFSVVGVAYDDHATTVHIS